MVSVLVVYADIIFLKELLTDLAVLWTTAWVRHQRPNRFRMLSAAVFGAIYAVLMIFPQLTFLYIFISKIVLSLVLLWIGFGFQSLQHYLRNLAAFYVVNFVAAGAVLGIYYLLMQGSDQVWREVIHSSSGWRMELKYGLIYFIAAFTAGIFMYRAVVTQKRERELVRTHLAEVEITIDNNVQSCVGLIDTGNQLYDPLTRTPVMVTEVSLWKAHLPEAWITGIAEGRADRLVAGLDQSSLDLNWHSRLRLVPYRGVNRGSQFMLAIKPDGVKVTVDGQVMETSRVLIGLDGGKLTSDGSYRAIIHPSMVQT